MFRKKTGLFPVILGALFLIALSAAPPLQAAPRFAISTANWTAVSWSATSCAGPGGAAAPGAADDVTICPTRTVTLNTNRTVQSITVDGTLGFIGGAKTLTVNGDITVNAGGTIFVLNSSNSTHTINVTGNIANAGTFDCGDSGADDNDLCNVNFTGSGTQTVSGAGATTRINRLTVNMSGGTINDIVDVTAANFSFDGTTTAGLTITSGTFRLSSAVTISPFNNGPFGGAPAGYVIPANGRFWLNDAGATVNYLACGVADCNLTINGNGEFRATAGTFNLGSAVNTRFRPQSGSTVVFEGATVNVGGRFSSVNALPGGNAVDFTMSAGTLIVGTVGNNSPTFPPFSIGTSGTFTMSGGTIVVRQGASGGTPIGYTNLAGTSTVTGGTVQIGDGSTPAGNTAQVNSLTPVWDFAVGSANMTADLVTNNLAVLDDLTISAGTLDANTLDITIGGGNNTGIWTNNGTFTAGTGTVTFTGTSATQAIGGASATTFNNLTINKSAGDVAINTTPTVGNGTGTDTLTLTQGRFVTGANRVILQTNATVATPGATSYIVGTLQKNYAAGAALNFFAGGNDFPVGDSANYTPLNITAGTTTTAGNLTVSTTATDHPQVTTPIASTTIDAAKSVNRYWTVTASGITLGTAADATFTTIGGTPVDLDAGVTPGNFIVQRYDGTNWNPTTLSGIPTSTSTSITGVAGFGDFAIGETLSGVTASPGRFNAFETSTPAGAILGKIQTRVASTSTTLAIVAINAAKTGVNTAFTGAVTVTLLDSSNNGGALDANGCRPTWTSIAGASTTTTFVAGDGGRRNLTFTPPANAYPDTRARIVDNATGLLIGCSTDRFALRPADLLLEALDADWQTAGTARLLHNTGATGGNVHAASTLAAATPRPFTLRATARDSGGVTTANYAGTPTLKSGSPACVLPAGCATGTLSVGAWSAASGVLSAPSHYSEAGTFNLEIEDLTFANVDLIDGSTAAQRTVPQAAPAPRQIGRFVPDRFILATNNAPAFKTFNTTDGACATPPSGPVRSFTYIGQPFGYATAPMALITAQNAGGGTTTNYRGSLWKLVGADVTENYSTSSVLDSSLKGTPTVAEISGTGTGIVTSSPSPADTVQFTRDPATPQAAFNANISLTVSVQDATENAVTGNGIIATGTSAIFDGGGTGIAFDSGNLFRYGRLKLANANGTPVLDLPLRLETQYWNGTTFVTHAADHCTILAVSNIALGAYQKNLNACETILSPAPTLTFRGGVALPKLTKPGSANNGSVDWTVNLGSTATGNTCLAVGGAESAATAANRPYLQGKWGGASYDQNPTARATFGVYKGASEFIYLRENY